MYFVLKSQVHAILNNLVPCKLGDFSLLTNQARLKISLRAARHIRPFQEADFYPDRTQKNNYEELFSLPLSQCKKLVHQNDALLNEKQAPVENLDCK